jgi:hypothetical protein
MFGAKIRFEKASTTQNIYIRTGKSKEERSQDIGTIDSRYIYNEGRTKAGRR